MPETVLARYDIAETRNAAAIMSTTTPEAFTQMIDVLEKFELTADKLTTPGRNRSVISAELDTAFRQYGWREARYDQDLTTKLTIFRWTDAPDPEETSVRETTNSYGGHKVDNVLGRAALDVEWNPKDGNLDRDLGNYVSLHEGGIIDVGVIVTRRGGELRELVRELSWAARHSWGPHTESWQERIGSLASDPLGTSTTANFDKLIPRLERGDGRGCPILAIGITERTYSAPEGPIEQEMIRLSGQA